ncbi:MULTISPECIES: glycosyltransferase family 4 protein [Mumia]|uniref:glycosyltransferase family 4 protein n=1 Tax=Mumia TaxID=1546255 RepID=UPI001420C5C9|nr:MULTISPECIES: glycosyltransferase family 4 protein [unclassified Mumia]QMW67939.1 glycosyltransferase family 4 protein [Mumia sp. ZJ1417]
MRIGMVCPYSFDVPGGVQNHVLDLTRSMSELGVDVSVLAPAADDDDLPSYVTPAGRALPVRYNGAVARVSFGPIAMARTRRWLRDGNFDVLHVHDPATPSVSLIALSLASGVSIATIHTSIGRSRALAATEPLLRPAMEKLSARITVSREAQRVVAHYQGGDSVIIPNGLFVDDFSGTERRAGESSTFSLLFLGRFEETRKGLPVLLDALPAVIERFPGLRLIVAGAGDPRVGTAMVPERLREHVEVVGRVSDEERARLLSEADVYVAPNTGGESFGIVLIEAMAAGAPVVASDIRAFADVLEDGRLGALFANEDPVSLAKTLVDALDDPGREERAGVAREAVRRYDWSVVAPQVISVYETVLGGGGA